MLRRLFHLRRQHRSAPPPKGPPWQSAPPLEAPTRSCSQAGPPQAPLPSSRVSTLLAKGLLAAAILGYCLQVASPVRLNTDAIVLLSTAIEIAQGAPLIPADLRSVHPPGYPALIALLLRLGLVTPPSLVIINLLFLSLGLLAAFRLFNLPPERYTGPFHPRLIPLLMLFSYVTVKHSTLPLTDIPYFAISLLALLCVELTYTALPNARRVPALLATAWILTVIAILLRRIGVALVPVMLVPAISIFLQLARRKSRLPRRIYLALVAINTLGLFASALSVRLTSSTAGFPCISSPSDAIHLLAKCLFCRLTELGELILNIPTSRLTPSVSRVCILAGAICLACLLTSLVLQLRTFSYTIRPTDLYLSIYLAILLVWPFGDARFWLPVLPFLFVHLANGFGRIALALPAKLRIANARMLFLLYLVWYFFWGLIALAYSTRISLSGSEFPCVYGDGSLRATYCALQRSCPCPYEPEGVNRTAIRILQAISRGSAE